MAQAFVWGQGGAQLTPEQVAQQRAIAEALMKEGSNYAPVGSWLEGLGRVANAAAGAFKEYRANQAEKAGQEAWQQKFSAIAPSLGGSSYGGPTGAAAPSASQDRMRSGAGISGTQANAGEAFASVAPRLIGDLSKDFGLTPEQAAGVVGQLGHESAGFGTLQEVSPMVPGSRGGYGYAQWTGHRRKAFEEYAAANGLDPTSYEANYGFLANELRNTPEGAVLQDVAAAPDAMTAGRIFTDKFLRPGIPGYDSRDKWTERALAYADPSAMGGQMTGGNPQAEVAAALMGTNPDLMPQQAVAMAPTQAGQQPMPQKPINTAGLNYDPATGAIGPAANLGPGATLAPAATEAFYGGQSPVQKTDTPILRQIAGLLGGGTSMPSQGAPSGQQAVAQALAGQPTPAQGAAAPQGMPSIGQLMELAADPYAPESAKAVVNALIQQQLQQQDPAYRMGLEKSQLELEQLRNPTMKPIEVGGVLLDPKTYQPIFDSRKPEGIPDSVRALDERATRAGLVPGTKEYNDFMISGGQQGNKIVVDTGTIPQGYQAVRDADGRLIRYDPVPGGPADNTSKQQAMENSRATMTDVVTSAAELARQAATSSGLPTTGVAGRVASNLPETNAAEVRRQVAVLKSNATIEALNAMRQQSPTGGALGNVTEKEGAMLAAKAGALDPDSPNFLRDLDDYERTLLRTIHGYEAGDKIYEQTRKSASPQPSGTSRSTLGLGTDKAKVDELLKKYGGQ